MGRFAQNYKKIISENYKASGQKLSLEQLEVIYNFLIQFFYNFEAEGRPGLLYAALDGGGAEDGSEHGDDELNDGFPSFFFHRCFF